MKQKLRNSLKIQSTTTSKFHVTTSSGDGNYVPAWQPPAINHRQEFLRLVHSVWMKHKDDNVEIHVKKAPLPAYKCKQNIAFYSKPCKNYYAD